jgi:hypothetical protein
MFRNGAGERSEVGRVIEAELVSRHERENSHKGELSGMGTVGDRASDR